MTCVFIRKEAKTPRENVSWRQRHIHRETKTSHEDEGRYWSSAATSQGMPEATWARRGKEQPSPRDSEGTWLCQYLDFLLLALNCERINSVVISHPVCGSVLWQFKGPNTTHLVINTYLSC